MVLRSSSEAILYVSVSKRCFQARVRALASEALACSTSLENGLRRALRLRARMVLGLVEYSSGSFFRRPAGIVQGTAHQDTRQRTERGGVTGAHEAMNGINSSG